MFLQERNALLLRSTLHDGNFFLRGKDRHFPEFMAVFPIRSAQADRERVTSRLPGFEVHSEDPRAGRTFRLKGLDHLSILF